MSQPSPHWTHDCDRCTYLDTIENERGIHDLYHCIQGTGEPTVIARFSSDGPDYRSGIVFAERNLIPELVEAYRLAKERGLNVESVFSETTA